MIGVCLSCVGKSGQGFVGYFDKGTKTQHCPDGLTATVAFGCDPKADWSKLPDNNITKYVTAEPLYRDCQV